ncbi:MAG: class I SAM-dependent methyltransferase [Candidatus Cloacimonadaceae bacterium]|jgi:ubiquinone/menaquinone biosynthesis C-methylase UbiE|nr:class I SAM-dependent methyltransferase [Candidatus Cloacimonadaceae bacterium]
MQVRLHISDERSSALYAALQFFPKLSDVYLQWDDEAHAIPEWLSGLSTSSLPGAVEVYPELGQAEVDSSILASLHVHHSLLLFWAKEGSQKLLQSMVQNMELYAFAADAMALQLLSGLPFHTISQVHTFYTQQKLNKALVLCSAESRDLILSIDPGAFVHVFIRRHDLCFSLAAELHDFNILQMQQALELICGLKLPDSEALPIQEIRNTQRSMGQSYSYFADHYDRYMAHVDYDLWNQNLISWHKQYGKSKGKKALELACGTANISSRMMVEGYQMDACDISSNMLMNASRKPLKPNLYRAALTDPIPGRDYDLIFCLFDSINYLGTSSDVLSCFHEVSKALKPGALFIFDISTLQNSLENFADNCNFDSFDDYQFVHEAWYESWHRRQISKLTFFQEKGPAFCRQLEQHEQRVYLCSELMALIQETDMKLLAIHSPQGKSNLLNKRVASLDKQHHRLFFILSTR